jgi:hypothetical protein
MACPAVFGMNVPADDSLHKILHEPDPRNPGTLDSLLIMNHVGTRIKSQRPSFSHERNLAPFAPRLDRHKTTLIAAARVKRPFNSISTRKASNLLGVAGSGLQDVIRQSKLLCDLQGLLDNIDSNKLVSTHRFRKHQGRKTHRAQPDNQNGVISAVLFPGSTAPIIVVFIFLLGVCFRLRAVSAFPEGLYFIL